MRTKRYTVAQGLVLARRLLSALKAPAERARPVFSSLMTGRLGDFVIAGEGAQHVAQATAQQLSEWHQALNLTLAQIVRARDSGWRLVSTKTGQALVTRPTFRGDVTITVTTPDAPLTVSGQPLILLIAQFYALVGLIGPHLQRCDCGQIFIRAGKQQFCSTRCQQRVYMRRYRKTQFTDRRGA